MIHMPANREQVLQAAEKYVARGKLDQALKEIRQAKSDAEAKVAYKKVTDAIAAEVPALPWAKIEEFIAWPANVKGVRQTNRSGITLDKAWIDK